MRSFAKAVLIVIGSLSSFLLRAQVNGTNLLEYQYGKLPDDTNAFSSVYDRAIVNYTYKKFKAGIGLEQFYTPFKDRNYTKLTQYSLQYDSKFIEVKIGTFYETLGRGLLLRSYEIPGAILEDLSYRSRYAFLRDIAGFSTKFRYKQITAKLLYGKPLNNVFPPTQPNSTLRSDAVKAIYADYSYKKQTFGASVLQLTNSTENNWYGMITTSGSITPVLSYYTEMAKNLDDYSISDFSKQASYALYGGINLAFTNVGVSAEYKKYNNFLLGSGINEPPALVKEHSYKVLNRSTHVLQPLNESGYQVEVYYTFPDLSTLTFNNTLAVNDFGTKFIFREYFTEYDFTISGKHDVKLFADFAQDPFKLEENRISAGSYFEWKAGKRSSVKTEFEFQTFKRSDENVQNYVVVLGYAYKSKFIFNIVSELTDDSYITEANYKIWLGANFKYQLSKQNSVQLFTGSRRGGPACNAGICYEVLDFKGVEIRLTSRF